MDDPEAIVGFFQFHLLVDHRIRELSKSVLKEKGAAKTIHAMSAQNGWRNAIPTAIELPGRKRALLRIPLS